MADEIGSRFVILRACVTFPDFVVLAFGAPGSRKDPSLRRLYEDLHPSEGGYEIELAAILTERLPTLQGRPEYAVDLPSTSAMDKIFCVSNVMQAIRFQKDGEPHHALCPMAATADVLHQYPDRFPPTAHIDYLPTVVTARYNLRGEDAEEALAGGLDSAIDDFIAGINMLAGAHLVTMGPGNAGVLTPVYDRGSFSCLYLLIRGQNGLRSDRLAASLLRATLRSPIYDPEMWNTFLSYAQGRVDPQPSRRALRMARSYVHAGAYELAILLLAIAVEAATARYVHHRLRQEGVSNARLSDLEADLTFSIMLNAQVMALAPASSKPDSQLIGDVDRIRRLRNDVMHKALFAVRRPELQRLVERAELYIEYLDNLSATEPPPRRLSRALDSSDQRGYSMNEREQVLAALANPNYSWRTCEGVSAETGLDFARVRRIIEEAPDLVIKSRLPDAQGRALYTTREHYRKTHSPVERLFDQFRSTST